MIPAIEPVNRQVYRVPMRSVLLRLLATLAVMLMPLGMAAAPAATSHHQRITMAMPMPMPMQHCPEPAVPGSNSAFAHCAMACAAALPAISSPEPLAQPVVRSSPQVPAITALAGVEPDIATPPPRLA